MRENQGLVIIVRIIFFCWLAFLACWLISARGAKKRALKYSWTRCWFRALWIAAILSTVRLQHLSFFRELSWNLGIGPYSDNPTTGIVGLIFCVIGISFAIWARVHIGRNWGMPMSLQQNHELVTRGPYQWVRHPIYTGILLAMLGSALAAGAAWFIPFLILCIYFVHSARTEEAMMMQQFPSEYPAYKKRTKMLIPFLF